MAVKRAVVFEFEAGVKLPGIDAHLSGPEQIFVISGVFNDGRNDYDEGGSINNPLGSAHIPQSKQGCTVLITFPEGQSIIRAGKKMTIKTIVFFCLCCREFFIRRG